MNLMVYDPRLERYPQVKGIYVGGCIDRGEGSCFRASAHAHCFPGNLNFGWICIRSRHKIYNSKGEFSRLLIHEIAHIVSRSGHNDKWRETVHSLGGAITARYIKRSGDISNDRVGQKMGRKSFAKRYQNRKGA
jgi:hypothetical protein